MKTQTFSLVTKIFGIVIASLFILIFVPHMIEHLNNQGIVEGLKDSGRALFKWYDNPTGLFTLFIIGYVIVWWKKLIGALVIITSSVLATLVNIDNLGWLIFTVPTMAVGLMYLFNWNLNINVKSNS